jgi:pimeloyl-ACP methyl ester carboxylesterase
MAIFVLVHGGWSGADIWRHVRRRLQAAGHEVFTPSLTGLGERVHLASQQVTLSTHVSDVANLVLYEDLSDVLLVGFSYGGFVVTGALRLIGERVRHLIYLDAFVPQDGDTVLGLAGRAAPEVGLGAPWLVPPPPRVYDDPVEAAFAADRRVPQPLGCLTEPVRVPRAPEEFPFCRTYIRATADAADAPGTAAFEAAAARAQASPNWGYREVATNHMVPANRPQELTKLLLEFA